jgi:flagellar biosynthesis protein FlhA
MPDNNNIELKEGFSAGILSKFKGGKYSDSIFAVGILVILTVMLFPIPVGLLDFMLSISITISVLILVNSLFIKRPLEFSSFPTILLIATLLRLSLNIATTRVILSEGHTGPDAAGHVIQAFGTMVISGNIVIGLIIFIILTIINFVVITKGSGRVAEVSARFSLDAMPGKQMAIDADLSAGLIDEGTAKRRRKDLEDESTFFGAMDGASKFVRGDAIAGIIITFVNLIGGILIGVVQKDMDVATAAHTYTLLSIGDGLVSQIPSLIVSTAAGLLVTKSGVIGTAESAVIGQLGKFPQTLGVASGLCSILAFTPIMPTTPFLILAILSGAAAWYLSNNPIVDEEQKKIAEEEKKKQEGQKTDDEKNKPQKELEQALKVDTITLELGYGLLPLINYGKGQKLTDQIKALRTQIAKELGFVMPSVRIQDNMQLPANTYLLKIKDIECGRGDLRPDKYLIMDPKGTKIDLPGEDTKEPTFGLPAKWIDESQKEEAMFKNYTVVPPPTVVTTHLTQLIKENIADLLSYSETQKLLDGLAEDHKKLVDDTVPAQVSVVTVQKVLQNLLTEGVSIRDLPTIIEALSEGGRVTKSVMLLTEHCRARLARQISFSLANKNTELQAISLSPRYEQIFIESLVGTGEEKQLAMPPSELQGFINKTRATLEGQAMKGRDPVLIVSPTIRPYVRAIVERFRPATNVLSHNEIHPKIKLISLGEVV